MCVFSFCAALIVGLCASALAGGSQSIQLVEPTIQYPATNVVGSFYNGSGYTGFLLTNGVYTDFKLNVRNPTTTAPIGINDYGVISGIYGTSKVSNQAFRQFGAKETDLQVPDATGTAATGTNDVLQTVGYFSVLASESALPLA